MRKRGRGRSDSLLFWSGIAATMLLAGCASSYQPRSPIGGYEEEWLGGTRFRVLFHHNAYTSEEAADALALRRAAELALENGYRYLRVEERNARHPAFGSIHHIVSAELLSNPGEDAREVSEIILKTEKLAGGRLSDRARSQLLEFEEERRSRQEMETVNDDEGGGA